MIGKIWESVVDGNQVVLSWSEESMHLPNLLLMEDLDGNENKADVWWISNFPLDVEFFW